MKDLPRGWNWKTVADLALPTEQPVLTGPFGSHLGRADFVQTGVPLLTIGCLQDSGLTLDKALYVSAAKAKELERYRLRPGDMLFSRMASVGRAAVVDDRFDGVLINYHLMRLRLDPQKYVPFLFVAYVRGAQEVREYLDDVNHGATRDGINTSQLLSMPVVVPPIETQHRIVAKLDALFDRSRRAREALDAVPALLDRLRQSILAAAFRGDLTADWRAKNPNVEPATELLKRIRTERRQKWEAAELTKMIAKGKPPKDDKWKAKYKEPEPVDDTELPALPEGWCWTTLDELLSSIEAGASFKCDERPPLEEETGVAKVSAVSWGEYNETESKTCVDAGRIHEALFIREGDFLVSRANTIDLVGAAVIVKSVASKVMLSDKVLRLHLVRTIPGLTLWMLSMLRSRWGRSYIETGSTGNQMSMRNISQDVLRKIPLPLPSERELMQMGELLEDSLARVATFDGVVSPIADTINTLERAMLSKAFCGELG